MLGLDTSVFIYYFEQPTAFPVLGRLFSDIEAARITAVASVAVLTEIYPQPLRIFDQPLLNRYREFFALAEPGITLIDVTRRIAEHAAVLRARYKIATPDALHLATAIERNVDLFLTNDATLKRVKEIRVACLNDIKTPGTI